MDASSLIMEGGGSSALPPKAYYFGDDVTDFGDDIRGFGDDVRDFDEFQRHMFSDEDDLPPTRGRSADLRSHLEDLANRHPEFADHLRSPPGWVNDLRGGKWSGGRSSSRDRPYFEGQSQQGQQQTTTADQGQEPQQQQNQGQQDTQQHCEGASGLSQHGLRNTVPDINSQAANEVRNQRSMSAPPDSNRNSNSAPTQQRFVSKIEINPVNPATGQTAADSKPPVPPNNKANMQNQQPPQHKTSTVRHIPIFVEGRDEPILPKNVDHEYVPPPPQPQPQQNSQQWQHNPQQWQQNSQPRQQPQQQQQFTSAQHFQPQRKPSQQQPFQGNFQGQQHQSASPPPQQQRPRDQTDSAPNHHHQQQQEQQPPPAPEAPKVDVNDPIYKVACIQKEVDALKKQIEAFQGNSRADKEFIYLDEMLTRNLLKLDNISTEGKENIRAVRKEAINSVQKCISLLESKIPSADPQKMEEDVVEDKGEESGKVEKEIEQNVEQQMVTESGAVAADGAAPPAKEENGPMEKVPKTEAQDNPNEIKC